MLPLLLKCSVTESSLEPDYTPQCTLTERSNGGYNISFNFSSETIWIYYWCTNAVVAVDAGGNPSWSSSPTCKVSDFYDEKKNIIDTLNCTFTD